MNSVPTITTAEAKPGVHAAVTAIALLLAACSERAPVPASPPAAPPAPVVTRSVSGNDISYQLSHQTCLIRWEIRASEPQVILHRSDCTLPLQDQQPLLEALWSSTAPAAGASLQLFWGRLCPDLACGEQQLSQRLASAAFHSAGWDAGQGRPVSGHANEFVRRLANASPIYPELRAFFAQRAYTVELSGIEKVLVSPASDLPYYEALRQQGVPPEARLPFDAMAWFRLTPRP
jgi:hypothetical protein